MHYQIMCDNCVLFCENEQQLEWQDLAACPPGINP
jgi:hypothetical protein